MEEDRKWLAEGQNDAFDPTRTWASLVYSLQLSFPEN
jgi:hypothetical protein